MSLPATPPRGKQYTIVRQSHVVDSAPFPVALITSRSRYDALTDAVNATRSIDHRLNPIIVLVDKEKA